MTEIFNSYFNNSGKLIRIFFLLLISVVCISLDVKLKPGQSSPVPPSAAGDTGIYNGIRYSFILSDTFYSFKSIFQTNSDFDCIFDVSYLLKHKRNFNKEATDIELVTQSTDWYTARYTFTKFLILNFSTEWVTVRERSQKRIDFKMLRYQSNMGMSNIITSSYGYYQFKKEKQGYTVEYYQECHVKKSNLSKIYLDTTKEESLKFISSYRSYVNRTC